MEEWIGGLWHRMVTGAAGGHHAAAAVRLADMEQHIGVLYRAFGGDPGRRVGGAAADRHHARRRWLPRLAGSDERVALASLEAETLRLPAVIDAFAEPELNRDLYLWLAALAASDVAPQAAWLIRNQRAAAAALQGFPGLRPRYRRLLAAHLAQRFAPENLPADEAAQERAIRAALTEPAECEAGAKPRFVAGLPAAGRKAKPPQPVLLWLSPLSPGSPQAASEPIGKVLDSAIANAANNHAMDTRSLVISAATARAVRRGAFSAGCGGDSRWWAYALPLVGVAARRGCGEVGKPAGRV